MIPMFLRPGTWTRLLATIAWCIPLVVVYAADQPQWGERFTRNQVSAETRLPESFDPATGQNLRWTAALGTESHSTPIVARGRVFMSTNNGRPRNPAVTHDCGVLLCFDERDGRLLWQLAVPKRGPTSFWDWPKTGMASPVTMDGDRIYVVSNRGEVLCLDPAGMENGNDGPFTDEARHQAERGAPPIGPAKTDADILWLYDVPETLGVRQHDGAHCSILVRGDLLYICTSNGLDDEHRKVGAPATPCLIVLDKHTGRLVARENEGIARRTCHSNWSSPSTADINGQAAIIFGGGDGVCYAFAALTNPPPAGEVQSLKNIWRFDCDPTGPKDDPGGYKSNRRVSPSVIVGMPVVLSNRVYVTGGGDLWWGKRKSWLKCIDATKRGDITSTGEIWSYEMPTHSMATPSVAGDLIYIADCGGSIHCLDRATGRPHWVHQGDAETWGSTMVADGKVYLGTRKGDLWVFAADREKKLLAKIPLGSPISGSVTPANGTLYVATMKQLFAATSSEKP